MAEPIYVEGGPHSLARAVNDLPEGRGILLKELKANGTLMIVTPFTTNFLKDWNDTPDLFHVVGQTDRDITSIYGHQLEHAYFKPLTPANDDFRVSHYRWLDMLWTIFTVPLRNKKYCFAAAKQVNGRLADGYPQVVQRDNFLSLSFTRKLVNLAAVAGAIDKAAGNRPSDDGGQLFQFPLNSERVYGIEPDHGTKGPTLGAVLMKRK